MLITILLFITLPFFANMLARGIAWKWKFMYKLRAKAGFLRRKPFICQECLATWLTLILTLSFIHSNIIVLIVDVIVSLLTYLLVKTFVDYEREFGRT